MAHSDRIKRVYKNHILKGTFGFAENGQFARRLKTGKADTKKPLRTSVTVSSNMQESDGTREVESVIEIFMLRDESDETVGGVNQLETGDLYWRDPKFDSNQQPYSWTGEVVEQGQHYTKAVFQRFKQVSHGKGRA